MPNAYDIGYARESFVRIRRSLRLCTTPSQITDILLHYSYEMDLIKRISPDAGHKELMDIAKARQQELLASA